MAGASKIFILGGGFSAHAGFPLVTGLRDRILKYIITRQHPSWEPHLKPNIHGFPQGQFYAGLQRVDPDGQLQFEELLIALVRHLRTATKQEPAFLTLRVLQDAVGRMFWDIFQGISQVPPAYSCFASWLAEREGETPSNAIVSFNWDTWAEWTLEKAGIPWKYCDGPIVPVLKPHGSINWSNHLEENIKAQSSLWRPVGAGSPFSYVPGDPFSDPFANGTNQSLRHLIFPGETESLERKGRKMLWDEVGKVISDRDVVVFIGYSLPQYDTAVSKFLKEFVRGKRIEVYNPNEEHSARFRKAFGGEVVLHPRKFEDSIYGTRSPN